MMKTKRRAKQYFVWWCRGGYCRVWMTEDYCTHFVHCSYTDLQLFILFFCIILLPSTLSTAQQPLVSQQLLVIGGSRWRSFRYITVGRTPLDEWSGRRTNLYLTIHNTHKTEPSYASDRIRTRIPSKWSASGTNLRLRGHVDRPFVFCFFSKYRVFHDFRA